MVEACSADEAFEESSSRTATRGLSQSACRAYREQRCTSEECQCKLVCSALTACPSTREALCPAGKAEVCFQVTTQARRRLSSLVDARVGQERIVARRVTRPTKRHFMEQGLAMRKSGRLRMDPVDERPTAHRGRSQAKLACHFAPRWVCGSLSSGTRQNKDSAQFHSSSLESQEHHGVLRYPDSSSQEMVHLFVCAGSLPLVCCQVGSARC